MNAAVVTGGSHGIGRAVVDRLASGERDVHVIDSDAPAEPFAPNVTLHQIDVRQSARLAETLRDVEDSYASIESLSACAGVKINRSVVETSMDDWDLTHDVNLKAMFVAVRLVLPAMTRAGRGAIVTVGSPSGYGDPRSPVYASSKAAIIGFSKSAALSLLGTGVRINTVVPGFTKTRMTGAVSDESLAVRGRMTASGSVNEPEDVAAAVAFLLSPDARNISGAVLEIGRTHGEPALVWNPPTT